MSVHPSSVALSPIDRTELRELGYCLAHAAVALVALIVLSPLVAAIALAVKCLRGGPVLYRGERVGYGERIFPIYKFRTLAEGAEQKIGARLCTPHDRELYGDRLGAFLKRTKLDELPQLLNVLRGDMRLVGPRPIRRVFLDNFEREIPHYAERFSVRPQWTAVLAHHAEGSQCTLGAFSRPWK